MSVARGAGCTVTACRPLLPRCLAYADQAGRAGLPAGLGIGWQAGQRRGEDGRAGFGRAGRRARDRQVNYWPMANRPPQTRYAQSSGAKIAFQVSGTGPPDLVMVHGLVSHLDLQWQQTGYRRFVRALERGGRLIRLDKRGTGLSDPCAGLPTAEERARDVAAVMSAARSSRAVLSGLSDGGRRSPSPRPIPAEPGASSSTGPRTG